MIPRYFRSIFEGGATELYYVLKHPKEAFHSNFVSLDCDQGSMVTQHGKPMFTQVSNPAGCGILKRLGLIPLLSPKMYSAVPQGGKRGSGKTRREGQAWCNIHQMLIKFVHDSFLGCRGTPVNESLPS